MSTANNGIFEADFVPDEKAGQANDEPKKKQADLVIEFVKQIYTLIFDENGVVYACHKTTRILQKLNSGIFKDEVRALFYKDFDSAINDQSLKMAFTTLAGMARIDNESSNIYMRAAPYKNGYVIDLCQSKNTKCVLVQAGRWEILDQPPVYFWRPAAMQPLPDPIKKGDIGHLWQVVNISEPDRALVVAWILDSFRTDTPYPVLELVAGQGAGKSLTQDCLRHVIDPNSENLRAVPNSTDDLFTVAGCNHLLSFENISNLSWQYQDAMCICATGGGYAKRMLYTDSDEIILKAKRPIIVNGISAAITRPDLVDRTISIELKALTERKDVKKLRASFDSKRGAIFGGLLDIMAHALAMLPEMTLAASERPRLVEFAYFGMAVSEAMGLDKKSFMQRFNECRHETVMRTIDASPVATAVIEWFEEQGKKERIEPLKVLFTEITVHKSHGAENWPKSVKNFGDQLKRAIPSLAEMGIKVESLGKIGSYIKWQISEIPQEQKDKYPDTMSLMSSSRANQDIKTLKTCSQEENTEERAGLDGRACQTGRAGGHS